MPEEPAPAEAEPATWTPPGRASPISRLATLLGLGDEPGDSPDVRILRRSLAVLAVLTVAVSLGWVALGIGTGSPFVTWTSLGFIAVVVAALAMHARTRWLSAFVLVFAAAGLAITLIGDVSVGGVTAGAGSLLWGFLTPIGALLYFGARRAIAWFGAFAVLVVVALAIDPLVRPLALELPYSMQLTFYAFNLLGACAVTFALLVYVDTQRRTAQARSEELLLNILPAPIAERLKSGERVIAQQIDAASVLFADLVDFTPMSERTPPARIVRLLNELFSTFDTIAQRRGLEKIKTIGDAYMAVAGVPDPRPDHARAAVEMALEMVAAAHELRDDAGDPLELRVGVASGAVVAGVIGRQKFSYDLWGDTVNTAARMETSGIPGCIQVAPGTHALLVEAYAWQRRDGVEVKGKGPMTTYLLEPNALAATAAPGSLA